LKSSGWDVLTETVGLEEGFTYGGLHGRTQLEGHHDGSARGSIEERDRDREKDDGQRQEGPLYPKHIRAGRGRCMCLFEATGPDLVKELNEQAKIPFTRIVEALDLTP
jgi:hypothetical protein